MQELEILRLENAYGINKLRVNVNSAKKLFQNLIYSKNGTFKTSFSRALYQISNGETDLVKDRITDELANIDMKIITENGEISDLTDKFLVFSREIYESDDKSLSKHSTELERLTINKKDKNYIEQLIVDETEEVYLLLNTSLKNAGLKFDDVKGLYDFDVVGEIDWLIEFLNYINSANLVDISKINLKKIFQKAYNAIDDNEFKTKAEKYLEVFNNKIKVELFDDNFDHTNCMDFISSLKKTSFLSEIGERGVVIKGEPYYDIKQLEKLFNDAINKVSSDPEVIEKTNELLKTMGTAQEAKKLREEMVTDPLLISQLSMGRKEIIRIFLKQTGINFIYWIDILEKAKMEVSRMLKAAVDKKSLFDKAIEIYTKRFHPVFDITIENRAESVLGLQVPMIEFKHKRCLSKTIDESELYSILSSGERTTLNILKFIVEYEANKEKNPFIILDDIVETFDYANRYAFIEYINDLVNQDVPVIVLTHNFEFYRTLSGRIPKLVNCVATSNDSGEVDISENGNILRNIENVLKINNELELLFSIPFVREANMVLQKDVELLTNCLHYKKDTITITLGDIVKELGVQVRFSVDYQKSYLTLLKEKANAIQNFDNFDLVKKTILSIASRIVLEEKIIGIDFSKIENVVTNQTRYLLDTYKNDLTDEVINLLERVQLFTPEFIHANSFMYEPLIDIEGNYLFKLYDDIKKIDLNNIWKKKN